MMQIPAASTAPDQQALLAQAIPEEGRVRGDRRARMWRALWPIRRRRMGLSCLKRAELENAKAHPPDQLVVLVEEFVPVVKEVSVPEGRVLLIGDTRQRHRLADEVTESQRTQVLLAQVGRDHRGKPGGIEGLDAEQLLRVRAIGPEASHGPHLEHRRRRADVTTLIEIARVALAHGLAPAA